MKNRSELVHTYSIIAIDKERGEMGGAVQSHYFSVGGTVIWAEAGIGVIATQAMVNIEYGPEGLLLLNQGFKAGDVLKKLTDNDDGASFRQAAVLDHSGNIASYTGNKTIKEAGHISGADYSCQANMMLKDTVWKAMSDAFESSSGPLSERLLLTLKAAESEGGDIRGKQSSSLTVVSLEDMGNVKENIIVDLRVEDNREPLNELDRLLNIHSAYNHADQGDEAIGHGDFKKALNEYAIAEELLPENIELKFWKGVSLLNNHHFEEAQKILTSIFSINNNWKDLLLRLPISEVVKNDKEILNFIEMEL